MPNFKQFPTCHCHPQSLDSASTPKAFAQREVELGSGTLTVTDHGSLAAVREVYDLAKKNGLIAIPGLEGYFRDDDCPILLANGVSKNAEGTLADYCKYFHITLHFLDQPAFECGVRLLSKAEERAERHGSERKPLFNWDNLEELGSYNVTATSSCLVGMVQRHLVAQNNFKMAKLYFDRLNAIFKPGNFYTEVFPHVCDRNWVQAVFVTLEDGTKIKYGATKKLRTNASDEIPAEDLAKAFGKKGEKHEVLLAVKNYQTWSDYPEPQKITKVEHIEDFIVNECRPWAEDGDIQKGANHAVLHLAKQAGTSILIGDDSHFAHPEDKIVQDVRLSQGGSWRFSTSYHRLSSEEAFGYFSSKMDISASQFMSWVDNASEWASRFKDFKFDSKPSLPTKFYPSNTLKHMGSLIESHGRMQWNKPEYVQRLQTEIELLHRNGTIDLLPYFFLAEESLALYQNERVLTGPGRGSAAGLLMAYLLGITHVDPLKYDLSLDRFLTLDRVKSGKLPDIDMDFPDRELLLTWLDKRFGDHYAQISVDSTLRLKMAVRDVARLRHGEVTGHIHSLCGKFMMPPQGVTDLNFIMGYDTDDGNHVVGSIEYDPALKEYVNAYSQDWEVVKKCLGLPRQKGRHASAFVVANKPIGEFIPLTEVSGVKVTQFTAKSVEAAGGIKMDFLVVNTLKDISACIRLIQERHIQTNIPDMVLDGVLVPSFRLIPAAPGNPRLVDIYDLPEDQSVFKDVAEGRTETVFQFNTPGAVQWLNQFNYEKENGNKAIDSILEMAIFTALDRPGPLDMFVNNPDQKNKKHNMLVEYARRVRGETPSTEVLPFFDELLPETKGIMCFQEQLQKCYQYLTGCTGAQAEEFRSDVAKKLKAKVEKAYTFFIDRATQKIGEESAKAVWEAFITWAEYGFNKSHAVSYAFMAYACAYLKHHYPLEWWCSVLKNANKTDINEKFWKYCSKYIELPDVKLSGENFEIQGDKIRAPISLLHGVGEKALEQLYKGLPYTDITDFCQKIQKHKKDGAVAVMKKKKKKDKKTGVETITEVPGEKLAHNALNRRVIYGLILSGAMDSLFPVSLVNSMGETETLSTADFFFEYEKAIAEATGKKMEAVNSKYVQINPLTRYQMRKSVLPAYSENIIPYVTNPDNNVVSKGKILPMVVWGGDKIPVITLDQFMKVDSKEIIPSPITVAVPCFIEDSKYFEFVKKDSKGKDKKKQGCEFNIDFEGAKLKIMAWQHMEKDGNYGRYIAHPLPEIFKEKLVGSIVLLICTKEKEGKAFTADDLIMVQKAISEEKEKDDEA